jgi:hypothetical protein
MVRQALIGGVLATIAIVPAMAQETDGGNDIVVEGRRDTQRLSAGLWQVDVSKAYHFGRNPDDWDSRRPAGSDRRWTFCLPDSEVVSLTRLLVGEGRSDAAGSTSCRPLHVRIGDGRLRATQACNGGSMVIKSRDGGGGKNVPAKHALVVTGVYDPSSLRLEFEDRQEPVEFSPDYAVRPDMRRWTVKGERVGACAGQRSLAGER